MPYIADTDVQTFLNISLTASGQATVNALIPAVETFAESYCNRTWSGSGAQTEIFDGGTQTFFPSFSPITNITSVVIDGVTYTGTISNYGSYIKLDTLATSGDRNVVITYTPTETLPDDLKHALIRWVAEIFKSSEEAGKTTRRVKAGSVEIDYLAQDGVPAFVEKVLKRYRLMPV